MKTSLRVKKLLSGVLIGGTLLSSVSGVAFANELSNLNPTNKAPFRSQMNKGMGSKHHGFKQKKHDIKKDINTLVEKGILTQEEADKLKDSKEQKRAKMQEATKDMTKQEKFEYMKENKPQNKGSIFAELVEKGLLTQERVDEIRDNIHQMKFELNKQRREERLNKLVEDGIITQAEADKWMEFSYKKAEERKVEMEKLKDMTQEERKEYFKENHKEKGERLKELVEAEVISQDAADKIKETHKNDRRQHRQGNKMDKKMMQNF
ncbi:MAG: hypothetical protein N4A48_08190 [Tepidibacter sp.]|jgi:hypothetical protein|uniref:hypothetical protein n=1 Tax=Tepidibacter sp. TaxID=2529387 RepID=UPI0025DAC89C|nr:hypothetical protein [Tepidibacter sp.]MCT4508727.1 hypothetical protein [Tepidibacter sp.]